MFQAPVMHVAVDVRLKLQYMPASYVHDSVPLHGSPPFGCVAGQLVAAGPRSVVPAASEDDEAFVVLELHAVAAAAAIAAALAPAVMTTNDARSGRRFRLIRRAYRASRSSVEQ
jgi:hypothetical protein